MKEIILEDIKDWIILTYSKPNYYILVAEKLTNLLRLYESCPNDMYPSFESFIEHFIRIEYDMYDFYDSSVDEVGDDKPYRNKLINYAVTYFAADILK